MGDMLRTMLLTGGSGFLGKHIYEEAIAKHIKVITLGRTDNSTIKSDITSEIPSLKFIKKIDLVVHSAGKAHVIPKTKKDEDDFYDVNLRGTTNLLNALENSKTYPNQFVFISTVAVYGLEIGNGIKETDALLGRTPYAKSKIKAEKEVLEWGEKHDVSVLVLRLPLVAGKKPIGNLGRMIYGIKKKKYLSINNGKAKKSIVLASDVAKCIIENKNITGIFNLTDGYHPSLREMEIVICSQLNKPLPASVPIIIGIMLGKTGDLFSFFPFNTNLIDKMSKDLTFDDSNAKSKLNWKPSRFIDEFKLE